MINHISKDDIVGQTISQFLQTKEVYSSEYEMTSSSLIVELSNGISFDLFDSFNCETREIIINKDVLETEKKTSTPCFEKLWGEWIQAIAISECYPHAVLVLSDSVIVHVESPTPWWVGAIYSTHDYELHDPLTDFWDGTLCSFNQ